jgi:aspartate/methionine/tyrosine aminotransferase
MNRIASTPYIEWAKQKKTRWNLSVSGLPHATLDDLGGVPADLPLAGDNAYGYAPLVERIAAHHTVSPSQVVVATGCSMANFLALAALVQPGDEVLIERPTYEPLLLAAAHLGASIVRFDRRADNRFLVDAEHVLARMTTRTRVIVLANLHNPSSQSVSNEVLKQIGDAATRVGARVMVDEAYLDAVFDATPVSSVRLDPAFVSTGSLTKVYGLSPLRCGWVIADPALASRVWRVNDLYENVRPFVPDWLAVRAFERLPALRARSRALLDTNRRLFADWACLRRDLEFTLPSWGTTVCLRPTTVDAARLYEELRARYDVTVVPGHFFELPDHVRLALCTEPATLKEGLARLGECLQTWSERHVD